MKNIKRIITIILIAITILANVSFADVGSFESYDSGSSWSSSSSWDYDYDDDDDYSSTSGGFVFFGNFGSFIIFIIIMFIIAYISKKHGIRNPMPRKNININPNNKRTKTEEQIENEIKANDELFNKDEIIAWSKTLFVRLQQSWTKRDWSEIRTFETNELFEQHKSQLQGYIDNNQINVIDRICVNHANLYDYRISGEKEILVIELNTRMQDYIIDATTKKVLRGTPNIERTNTYLLTFERKFGVKTKPGTMEVNTTNCPNCGAPTKITSAGECEYCGSIITTEEYNWCLANLERATY